MRFISVNFIPESVEPISDSQLLISGSQTCIYDYVNNLRTCESPTIKNAVYSEFTLALYGFQENFNEVFQLQSDLTFNEMFRFDGEIQWTHAKIYRNLLVLLNSDKSAICVYNLENNQVLYSATRNTEAGIYLTQSGLIAIKEDESGNAILEKGVYCTIEELFKCLLKDGKLDTAVSLCVSETELQSLDVMRPLLLQLTRKKEGIAAAAKGQLNHYSEFLDLVKKLENVQSEKESIGVDKKQLQQQPAQLKQTEERKINNTSGPLWANVVLKKAKEREEQNRKMAESIFLKRLFKKQQEIRKSSRWALYLSWYKSVFLKLFPCIQSAPVNVIQTALKAKRVLRRTAKYILSHTAPEQILVIGKENMLESYRVFKWMMRALLLKRPIIDYSTTLQTRMNQQVFRGVKYLRLSIPD